VRVGLALIAKDEAETLPRLLATVEGAFDRVALADTGSSDDTVKVFETWAQAQVRAGRLGSYTVQRFDWIDDFAAARNFADALLAGCDWYCWADCDDEIRGAHQLRRLAEQSPPELVAWVADYDYAQDPHGNCICRLRRERLVRAGHGRWVGRVHEAQLIDGPISMIDPAAVEWVHRKQPGGDGQRNLRILRKWIVEEAENARVLGYLGFEELARGRAKHALRWFRRYLKLKTGWDEERAQVHRRYALALREVGRTDQAIDTALEAVRLLPSWPDSYLTLAECHYELNEPQKAAEWARDVIRRGVPDTILIIDPTDYVVKPRVILAGALAQMGDLRAACQLADEVFRMVPGHAMLAAPYRLWRGDLKREETAELVVKLADGLIAHDEQLKAAAVLSNVPHYAQDHPRVVQLRVELASRLDPLLDPDGYSSHYVTGGTKPEDMVADPVAVGDVLPRCAFLLEHLTEMKEAA
jgi:cytochrome c-type biogenesis protein CcmH/NrfG